MLDYLKRHWLLLLILVLAGFLRLYKLGEPVIGFFRDEAALGYNAYSVLKTGRDEFGQLLPVIFRSFEVFFLPAYEYLSVPLMAIFGLNVFSTRLLSALAGTATVLITYLITQKVWGQKRKSLLAAGLVAIVPWHLFYSRGAFEGNLGLFFFALGVWLFLRSFGQRPISLWLRVWFFLAMTLSMYSYQAPRLVVPLWTLTALWIYRKEWKTRQLVRAAFPAIILALPLIWVWFTPAGLHRAVGVSLFQEGWSLGLVRKIAAMYVNYFSPENLFWGEDYNPQRGLVGVATMYWWLLPGLLAVFRGPTSRGPTPRGRTLITVWALIGPLPAAVTTDPFHTYRSLLMFLPLTLLAAAGTDELLKKWRWSWLAIGGLLIFSISRLVSSYFYVTPVERALDWDQPFERAVKLVEKYRGGKEKIVFDTSYSEPYIQYLFWSKFEPKQLYKVTRELPLNYYGDAQRVRFSQLNNVFFEEVDWPTRRGDKGTVFVVPNSKVPPSEYATDPKVRLLETVEATSGETVFRFLEILN